MPATADEVQGLLEATGAVRRGHFRLSSGLHSPVYVQCALVLQHPEHALRLASLLASEYRHAPPEAVASPALGGIVWGHELARQLGARAVFVERGADGRFALRRFELKRGEKVLVAEDVITTGGSTLETISVVRAAGGEVIGVAAIVDRSSGRVQLGVPLRALLTQNMEAYLADACPLCREGRAIEKPGSRPEKKEALET
jgi:orotate phosphoribosyltransferase